MTAVFDQAQQAASGIEAMTFGLSDIVDQNAQWFPDAPALLQLDTRLTWDDFRSRSEALARGIVELGIGVGERVALLADNAVDYVVLQYALARMGGILVPVNTRLAVPEIAHILNDCEPSLLLHDDASADRARAAAHAVPGLSDGDVIDLASGVPGAGLWGWVEATAARGESAPPLRAPARDWERPHTILYTGGTTGRPKGAVICHRRNILDGLSTGSALGLRAHERFLSLSPLSHTAAWDYIKAYFLVGGAAAIMDRFDAAAALRALERHRCNGMWAVPLMLQRLIDAPEFASADLSSMRLVAYSAYDPSELMPKVVAAFERRGARGIRLAHGYGLTEAGPFLTVLRPEEALQDPTSVGTPVPGVRLALLDDEERPVPRGEVGEVCAQTPAVMSGYWRNPEATAEIFRGGWLHTGDLGRINERGHLVIVDRKKDMIRTAGENVFAKEVESALMSHRQVADCAVIGRRDRQYDERVVAIVVAREPEAVTAEELQRHAREQLAGFKVPREVLFVDSLPKTAAGKTAKAELRKRYGDAQGHNCQLEKGDV